ncbi:hypothetical protein FM109_04270 [Vibrio casei]|nr:hypothetical protein FM109_04270 [Vibrio casei]
MKIIHIDPSFITVLKMIERYLLLIVKAKPVKETSFHFTIKTNTTKG